MSSLKTNIFFKISMIIVIALLLLIPATMIRSLVRERENTQEDAIKEVSSKWSEEQTLSGPFLSVPFYRYVKEFSKTDSTEKIVRMKEYIHFLPTNLNMTGKIFPEKRTRGIYEIVVYNSTFTISGIFQKVKFTDLEIPLKDILFDKAFVSLGINDLRGIEKQIVLSWNNDSCLFNSGTVSYDVVESGINAPVTISSGDSSSYKFSFNMTLKGSQKLFFTPVGEITDISTSSTWNNPSFNGAFLPDTRTVNDSGFSANWNILHLNRNFPQRWVGNKFETSSSSFGIDLLLPVDSYQKTTRSVKYALLFICFTFIVFFFVEVLNKIFIHPVQYILVGIALVIFFTLLLSISEHVTFNMAYIISGVSTLLLIAGYIKAILKSTLLTSLISGILFFLYSFIFVIIQLQDYALLIGSIGLFIILCLAMYFSRKIDWYNLKLGEGNIP
ncbi:MAG: hypothetical protein A3H98_12035 [Bacteroidetes bacterium RIFCSPLOWO2_02_FULL_36_8]|nr:MAG: hypothetical protein A3H98_12035 [Bacteroidetes bacterium RIFCSPLOWO2_02_FULL_36_8]OFY69556.1 MAG: hypothetical protein A3G23_10995 [Bacteroidetes bacterium RIFCSPLOWO2_12_FULL_37_12]